jgi:hypothetical protein
MKIFLTVLVLVGAVFLGRETGLYDFHWVKSEARSTLNTSWETVNYRRGLRSIADVKETPGGAELLFSDGSQGTLTLQNINCSGAYWIPLFKHVDVTAKASFASGDGRLTATYDFTGSIDFRGSCSVRFVRKAARAYCINVMLADLGNRL